MRKIQLFDVISNNLTDTSSTKYILNKIEKDHIIILKRYVCNYYSINSEIKHKIDLEYIILPDSKKYKIIEVDHKEKYILIEEVIVNSV